MPACQPSPGPPAAQTPEAAKTGAVGKPAWQQDWDATLAAAKQEGKVVAITSFGGESTTLLAKTFKDKYGIDMEFVIGRAPEIDAKVKNERRAGLYLEDVYLAGLSSITLVKDAGFLDSMKPLLVLPDVTDPKNWMDGSIGYHEKEGLMIGYLIKGVAPILINTDIVKPEEMISYQDLMNPKWKGKIVVFDPTIGSGGTIFFLCLYEFMGPEFTRQLAGQDLAITGDSRQQAEWLARGKYPVSGTISDAALTEMMKAGTPIKIIMPKEGTVTTTSTGAMSVMNKGPNPNAGKILANWILTKEGQTLMSQIFGAPSRRTDIKYDWVDPAFLIKPGYKYIDSETDEMIAKRISLQTVSREAWNVKQ